MPDADGEPRECRDKLLPRVPTVAHGYSMTGGALDAGLDEYLVKPVSVSDMHKLPGRYRPEKVKRGD